MSRINYSRAISQAEDIDNIVKSLTAQITKLDEAILVSQIGWAGDAASAFIPKLSSIRREMDSTKNMMSGLATELRNCADRINNEK